MDSSVQLNLRWNNQATELQNVFCKKLEREEFVDVTLACEEGQSIKCHRLILSAGSIYLNRILRDNPSPNLVIFLKDMKFWELRTLVTFMYQGEINVSPHELPDLRKAAEALKVKGLALDTGLSQSNEDRLDDNMLSDCCSIGSKESPVQLQNGHGDGPIQIGQQQKSVLRQQNNLSAYGAAAANRLPQRFKRKILTQLPQLVKLQRKEQQSVNGAGISGGGENLKVQQLPVYKIVANEIPGTVETSRTPISQVNENYEDEDVYSSRYNVTTDNDDGYLGNGKDIEEIDGKDENEPLNIVGNDSQLGPGQAGEPEKIAGAFRQAVQNSALFDLQSGMALRQCSDAYGILKKTLSKRKCRKVKQGGDEAGASPAMTKEGGERMTGTVILPPQQQPRGSGGKYADRAELYQKATELALSGITVRRAAAFFEIPRTTLCAYMKRRGLTGKGNFLQNHDAGAVINLEQPFEGKKSSEASSAAETNDGQGGRNSSGSFRIPDFPFPDNLELMNAMSLGIHEIEVYAEGEEEYSEK